MLYKWQIHRTVSPATVNLLRGDSAVVTYGLVADRDSGTNVNFQSGSICVTNNGSSDTQNLAITADVQASANGSDYTALASGPVDVSAMPILPNGQSYCYPFRVDYLTTPGATHRVTAKVSISNFSQPPDLTCTGVEPCAASVTVSDEFQPIGTVQGSSNETIHVSDTMGGSFTFSAAGTQTFTKTYACDAQAGINAGTATIQEPDQTVQADTSEVTVNCQAPTVSPTASSDLTLGYAWTVAKSADRTQVTLPQNQATSVTYLVNVRSTPQPASVTVTGQATLTNPSAVSTTVTAVQAQIGTTPATVDCHRTMPFVLPPNQSVVCDEQAQLSNASGVLPHTVTMTIGNVAYSAAGVAQPAGTTTISATSSVDLSQAAQHQTDACVSLADSLRGSLGTVCQGDLTSGAKLLSYPMQIGPYTTCGAQPAVTNVVTLTGSIARATSSVVVTPTVSCPTQPPTATCVDDFDFWRDRCGSSRHSIEANVPLPITLGTVGGAKSLLIDTISKAREVVSLKVYGNAENGITQLYAALLIAKLNVKAGASSVKIGSTITAADQFLATKNWKDWNSLSKSDKSKVNDWTETLEKYNDGKYGVKRCDDDDHRKRWGNDWFKKND